MKKLMIFTLMAVLLVFAASGTSAVADWAYEWNENPGGDGSYAKMTFLEGDPSGIQVAESTLTAPGATDGFWQEVLDEGWYGYRVYLPSWPLLWRETGRDQTAATWVPGEEVRVAFSGGHQLGTLSLLAPPPEVPEPASLIMFGLAMAGGWFGAGYKKKK